MMHGPLYRGLELDYINSQPGALGEGAIFVVDGFDLDSVQRNEGCLSHTLVAHILSYMVRKLQVDIHVNGTSMQSIAVFSSSTTIASMFLPKITPTAVSCFLCIGLHKSTTRP
jgi:hypothetical protein